MPWKYSPSVDKMIERLAGDLVSAEDIVRQLLETHDYARWDAPKEGWEAGDISIEWPRVDGLRLPVEQYVEWIGQLFQDGAWSGQLHGRSVIVGAALLDRAAGRAIVASGLFFGLARELDPNPFTVLTADGRGRLRSIPLADWESFEPATMSVGQPIDVAVNRDASVAAVVLDSRTSVHRLPGWETIAEIEPSLSLAAALSPDGSEVRIVSAGEWGRFDARTGERTSDSFRPFESDTRWVMAADGGVLVGGDDAGLAVTNPDGSIRTLEVDAIGSVRAVSPYGRLLATVAEDDRIRVVRLDDGSVTTTDVQVPASEVTAFAVSNGGGVVIGGRGLVGTVATSPSVTIISPKDPSAGSAQSFAYSPDGRLLAAGGEFPPTRVVAADTLRTVAEFPFAAQQLRWSGDGHWLVAADGAAVNVVEAGLSPAPVPSPPITYSADVVDATGTDLMDVDPTVDAFASLVAARDLEPPLSIGVFGEWGSGKTFFMRRLRQRVAERSRAARESRVPQREVSFAKRIVQIEFNAWHYSAGNLWAALTQHILDNLRLFGEEPMSIVAERQQKIIRRMDDLASERATLAAQQETAVDHHREARQALARLERQQRDEIEKLESLSELGPQDVTKALDAAGVDTAAIAELKQAVGEAGNQAEGLIREAQRSVELMRRSGAIASSIRGGSTGSVLALVVVLLGAPAIGLLAGQIGDLYGIATGVGAFVAGAVVWLRRQNDWFEQRIDQYERVETALTSAIDEKKSEHAAERSEHEARIGAIGQRIEDIGRRMARIERQRTLLDEEYQNLTPTQVLSDYVLERAASDDYRKHLGLHARIREDFETIAAVLDEQRLSVGSARTIDEEEHLGDHRIDRIVLYIDDLDRCEPNTVVDVLQAVHLLLAFPVFVVVVGVDARWVSRALIKRYPELLRDGGHEPSILTFLRELLNDENEEADDAGASSLVYLEKIFQIPFWLAPLERDRAARFVGGLVGEAPAVAGTTTQPTIQPTTGATPGTEPELDDDTSQPPQPPAPAPAPPPGPATPDLTPAALTISAVERDYMIEVAALLGPTPRAVKRFLNMYRLTKVIASDPDDFLAARAGYGAPFQAVMILLAVDNGMPDAAEAIFTALSDAEAQTLGELIPPTRTDADAKTWRRFDEWVSSDPHRQSLSTNLFVQWVPTVRPLSFSAYVENV